MKTFFTSDFRLRRMSQNSPSRSRDSVSVWTRRTDSTLHRLTSAGSAKQSWPSWGRTWNCCPCSTNPPRRRSGNVTKTPSTTCPTRSSTSAGPSQSEQLLSQTLQMDSANVSFHPLQCGVEFKAFQLEGWHLIREQSCLERWAFKPNGGVRQMSLNPQKGPNEIPIVSLSPGSRRKNSNLSSRSTVFQAVLTQL